MFEEKVDSWCFSRNKSSSFPKVVRHSEGYINFADDFTSPVVAILGYQICYKGNSAAENSCMKVDVDRLAMKIHFHMPESDDFDDVETLEDYSVGLAASRVVSQEACYVRRLVKSFEQQVAFIKGHQDDGMRVESDVRVSAVSLDNPEEEIGSDLANFCGDLPVYKLVTEEQNDSVQDRRQVSVTFTRCILLCFIPRCFTTTLTLPTGSTITFGWLFFG
nr:uncharacterized protein LOC113800700 [Penaeus vannamei]